MENNNKVNYYELLDTMFQKALLDADITPERFAVIAEQLMGLEGTFSEAVGKA